MSESVCVCVCVRDVYVRIIDGVCMYLCVYVMLYVCVCVSVSMFVFLGRVKHMLVHLQFISGVCVFAYVCFIV